MNEDRIIGSATKFGGDVETGIGNATNSSNLQADGLIDQAKGTAQNLFGEAKDVVRNAIDGASPRVKEASATAIDTAKNAPLLTALAVGAAGYLLAWAIHGSSSNNNPRNN